MFEELNSATFVREFTSGDPEAFRRLFSLLGRLATFIERMGINGADAEELAADALLKVYKSRHTYDPTRGAKLTTWVFEVGRHLAIDHLRAKARLSKKHVEFREEYERVERIRSGDEALNRSAAGQAIETAVARLSAADQDILRMRQVMEYKEIAAVEGASEEAVRVRVKRAMDRLKQLMEEQTHG